MHDLRHFAEAIGVRVLDANPGPGKLGCYIHERRLVIVKPGLRSSIARYTLAHELGHAVRGDQKTGVEHYDARQELQADAFAARLLIKAKEVERAEIIYGSNATMIAHELDVPMKLLAVWRGLHQRIHA